MWFFIFCAEAQSHGLGLCTATRTDIKPRAGWAKVRGQLTYTPRSISANPKPADNTHFVRTQTNEEISDSVEACGGQRGGEERNKYMKSARGLPWRKGDDRCEVRCVTHLLLLGKKWTVSLTSRHT